MTELSNYVKYLPPALWARDRDPTQFLGRTLRIFEKILTGIPINSTVFKARVLFITADGIQIQLDDSSNAALFRPGDVITIEGTIERATISHIIDSDIFLVNALSDTYTNSFVRIADLEPHQTQFRLDHDTCLGPGSIIKISQASLSEIAVVNRYEDDFVQLQSGLTQTYPLRETDVPITIQDGQPLALKKTAKFVNAANDRIVLSNVVDANKFRLGDVITIEGTTEEVEVSRIINTEIFLVTSLIGDYDTGVVSVQRQIKSVEEIIADIYHLFNPWSTPREFLPWLASWVDLMLRQNWSEYQQRKLISEIVSVYQQRGLKRGLQAYLDIYVATPARPRIAIDDGEALFRATFAEDDTAHLHTVAYSHSISLSGVTSSPILLHPTGLSVDSNNNYVLVDQGDLPQIPPTLWRISSTGEIDYASSGSGPPIPHPIHSGAPLTNPTAVIVDRQDQYNILDIGTVSGFVSLDSAIYRFSPPNYTLTIVIDQTTTPTLPAVRPVDMVLDRSGNFVILDRGGHPLGDPPAGPAAPKIVVVSEAPLAVTTHSLDTVTEPTAIVMDAEGRFIVADAKDQYTSDPVDLIRIDPANNWAPTSLLSGLSSKQNPLVFPTGFAFESPNVLLVCDTGVRWGYDSADPEGNDPAYRYLAEPAAIYRVDLSQSPPTITRVTPERQLVNPTKMAIDRRGALLISDRGESLRSSPQRNWRSQSNEFGVIVHFSRQRQTTFTLRNQIRREIMNVVEQQKPGHSKWWMDF